MENASKALLISGGILIAIIILTMGVYLFATYGQLGEEYQKNLSSGEIRKFNSNFIQFEERENITAQEIVTLYKFVKSYNEKNEILTSITAIQVSNVTGSNIPNSSNDLSESDLIEFIKNNSNDSANNKIIYFECTNIEYDESTGMVNKIEFKKI